MFSMKCSQQFWVPGQMQRCWAYWKEGGGPEKGTKLYGKWCFKVFFCAMFVCFKLIERGSSANKISFKS